MSLINPPTPGASTDIESMPETPLHTDLPFSPVVPPSETSTSLPSQLRLSSLQVQTSHRNNLKLYSSLAGNLIPERATMNSGDQNQLEAEHSDTLNRIFHNESMPSTSRYSRHSRIPSVHIDISNIPAQSSGAALDKSSGISTGGSQDMSQQDDVYHRGTPELFPVDDQSGSPYEQRPKPSTFSSKDSIDDLFQQPESSELNPQAGLHHSQLNSRNQSEQSELVTPKFLPLNTPTASRATQLDPEIQQKLLSYFEEPGKNCHIHNTTRSRSIPIDDTTEAIHIETISKTVLYRDLKTGIVSAKKPNNSPNLGALFGAVSEIHRSNNSLQSSADSANGAKGSRAGDRGRAMSAADELSELIGPAFPKSGKRSGDLMVGNGLKFEPWKNCQDGQGAQRPGKFPAEIMVNRPPLDILTLPKILSPNSGDRHGQDNSSGGCVQGPSNFHHSMGNQLNSGDLRKANLTEFLLSKVDILPSNSRINTATQGNPAVELFEPKRRKLFENQTSTPKRELTGGSKLSERLTDSGLAGSHGKIEVPSIRGLFGKREAGSSSTGLDWSGLQTHSPTDRLLDIKRETPIGDLHRYQQQGHVREVIDFPLNRSDLLHGRESEVPGHNLPKLQNLPKLGTPPVRPLKVPVSETMTPAHRADRRYPCPYCPYRAVRSDELKRHQRTKNKCPGPANRMKEEPKHKCDEPGCTSVFFRKDHLDTHKRKHTGEKPYPCHYYVPSSKYAGDFSVRRCGKKFARSDDRRRHHQKVHEAKNHTKMSSQEISQLPGELKLRQKTIDKKRRADENRFGRMIDRALPTGLKRETQSLRQMSHNGDGFQNEEIVNVVDDTVSSRLDHTGLTPSTSSHALLHLPLALRRASNASPSETTKSSSSSATPTSASNLPIFVTRPEYPATSPSIARLTMPPTSPPTTLIPTTSQYAVAVPMRTQQDIVRRMQQQRVILSHERAQPLSIDISHGIVHEDSRLSPTLTLQPQGQSSSPLPVSTQFSSHHLGQFPASFSAQEAARKALRQHNMLGIRVAEEEPL